MPIRAGGGVTVLRLNVTIRTMAVFFFSEKNHPMLITIVFFWNLILFVIILFFLLMIGGTSVDNKLVSIDNRYKQETASNKIRLKQLI
jgi:hypothetical protein